jgi:gamma-glutamylcyclotransferase (GGCT)/AIG2-like uncharacterized protein YtfP
MKNKRLYIAYGSNLNVRQMAMRCPAAKIIGTGELQNYELQFKGCPSSAFATIAPIKGLIVPVLIWELQKKDEKALDLYEGFPSHYYKQNMPIAIGNKQDTAMVYIMSPKRDFGIPSNRYYNTLLEGYDKLGFNVNILNDAVDKSIAEFRKLGVKQSSLFDYEVQQDDIEDDENLCNENEIEEDDNFYYDSQLHL